MKIIIYLIIFIFLLSCTNKSPTAADQPNPQQLLQRGKLIYNLNCIACHNSDPDQVGTVGPAIKGSSKELLEAKILHATYPTAYKAKRDSKLMPTLPILEKEISALEAFLK